MLESGQFPLSGPIGRHGTGGTEPGGTETGDVPADRASVHYCVDTFSGPSAPFVPTEHWERLEREAALRGRGHLYRAMTDAVQRWAGLLTHWKTRLGRQTDGTGTNRSLR